MSSLKSGTSRESGSGGSASVSAAMVFVSDNANTRVANFQTFNLALFRLDITASLEPGWMMPEFASSHTVLGSTPTRFIASVANPPPASL